MLCFNDGHKNPHKRPTAKVWLEALEVAFNELQSCGKIDSHFYNLSYGHCYWCDRVQDLEVDIFPGGSMVKSQPIKPLSQTKPQPTVVKPIVPNLPIAYQSQPQLFLTRRKILVGMGLLGTGGAITWIGSKKTQSTSLLNPNPSPKVSTEMLPGEIKLEMITIPAGKFLMGSPDNDSDAFEEEKPQHEVQLSSFLIGKYPVTQEQYQTIMGINPSFFKNNLKNPVEQVSWDNAKKFCQRLNKKTGKRYRLPSEAEWEYACRAGSQTRYYFGDDAKLLGQYAWYGDNSGSSLLNSKEVLEAVDYNLKMYSTKLKNNYCRTHPIGQKKPNNWGLFDMIGNVWEWCEDRWHDSYKNAPINGRAWIDSYSLSNRRVVRGSSWLNTLSVCRSATRSNFYHNDVYSQFIPDNVYSHIGFRLVRSSI